VLHGFWCSIPVPACSTCDLIVVLADPGSCVCRGSSRACLEVASRVVLSALASGCCSYTDSRILPTGEFWLHRGQRGGVPSKQVPTVSRVASQRPGWRHRARDGCIGSKVMEGMCSAHPVSRHRPRRSPGRQPYASRWCRRTPSRVAAWKKDGVGWHSVVE
jgi:hypothetical protein